MKKGGESLDILLRYLPISFFVSCWSPAVWTSIEQRSLIPESYDVFQLVELGTWILTSLVLGLNIFFGIKRGKTQSQKNAFAVTFLLGTLSQLTLTGIMVYVDFNDSRNINPVLRPDIHGLARFLFGMLGYYGDGIFVGLCGACAVLYFLQKNSLPRQSLH